MLEVSPVDILARSQRDNPWWQEGGNFRPKETSYPRRAYFERFCSLVKNTSIKRATILVGPRRVGKTVMLMQLIGDLLAEGTPSENILYASIDAPIFANLPLERFLTHLPTPPRPKGSGQYFVIFDEIQYRKDWEIHLKDLVDNFPNVKFIASGSAAAALARASKESGAGRFSDFKLPPMTFAEFLQFTQREDELITSVLGRSHRRTYSSRSITALNSSFIDYVNYGGYPEAVLSEEIRSNTSQYLKNDIIDKVLLKDLPALYGIDDIQELNSLFAYLAYNTGQELSLQGLAQKSNISKPTINKYISYLESAFLLMKVSRVDRNATRFQRETNFKVYLTNPSMRAALFSPVKEDQPNQIGHLAETAIFAQWAHIGDLGGLYYARWKTAEIDIVSIDPATQQADWAVEVKWSDKPVQGFSTEMKGLADFIRSRRVHSAFFTTKTLAGSLIYNGLTVEYEPCSLYCYKLGVNTTKSALMMMDDEYPTD